MFTQENAAELTQISPTAPQSGSSPPIAENTNAPAKQENTNAPAKRENKRNSPPPLKVISAVDLQKKVIPPTKFLVDGLIPAGLTIFAGPSKYKKSWLVLDMCLSVSEGRPFLGYATNKAECLYLALEDEEGRLKYREGKVREGSTSPTGFYYSTFACDMDNGLFEQLEGFLEEHPGIGLIVIDTLQKVRGATRGREGVYAADYREMSQLKSFADRHNIALLLVHHLRKMRDFGDPFAMISGTTAIMGACDTVLVLTKSTRNAETATLSVEGRDVESTEIVMKFNGKTCKWANLGNADDLAEQQAKAEYQQSPVVRTIKKLLEQSPNEKWSGSAKNLLEACPTTIGQSLDLTPKALGIMLQRLDMPLQKYDGIIHTRSSHGTGGGTHYFYYANRP